MEPRLTKAEKKALKKQEWQEKLNKDKRSGLVKKIAIWGGVVVILGLVVWGLIAASNTPTASANIKMPPITSTDITNGVQNPKVTMVEYADFQCPGCGAYYPIVKQLLSDYSGKMLYVYRYFPLHNIHQNAINSAAAAEAARRQGKFFQMADLLFTNQTKWAEDQNPDSTFYAYAQELGLNLDQFKKDYSSQSIRSMLSGDFDKAVAIGLPGTPSFFINGKYISNLPQSYADFKALIQNGMK